jgi:hypothetical protein
MPDDFIHGDIHFNVCSNLMYYYYIHYFPGTFEEDGSFIGLYGSMGRKVRLSAEFNPPPPPGSATFV